jgi:hypothetical protein
MQAKVTDINPINGNLTLGGLYDTEQGQGQGRLSRPCTSYYANLTTFHGKQFKNKLRFSIKVTL